MGKKNTVHVAQEDAAIELIDINQLKETARTELLAPLTESIKKYSSYKGQQFTVGFDPTSIDAKKDEGKETLATYYFYQQLNNLTKELEDSIDRQISKKKTIEVIRTNSTGVLITEVVALLNNLQNESLSKKAKIEAISHFEKKVKPSKKKQRILGAIAGVIVGAVGVVLGVGIGAGAGFAAGIGIGLWTGPGSMITAMIGTGFGMFIGATMTPVALATLLVPTIPPLLLSLLGVGSGIVTAIVISKHKSPVEKIIKKTARTAKECARLTMNDPLDLADAPDAGRQESTLDIPAPAIPAH